MALRTNTFDGGTNGTTISTANSGGSSGTAFDAVAIAAGGVLAYVTPPWGGGGLALHATTTAGANQVTADWIQTLTEDYGRAYIYVPSVLTEDTTIVAWRTTANTLSARLILGATGGTVMKLFVQNSSFAGNAAIGTVTLSAATLYRVEWHFIPGAGTGSITWRLFLGDSTTQLDSGSSSAQQYGTSYGRIRWALSGAGTELYLDSIVSGAADFPGPLGFWADPVSFSGASTVAGLGEHILVAGPPGITFDAASTFTGAGTLLESPTFGAAAAGDTSVSGSGTVDFVATPVAYSAISDWAGVGGFDYLAPPAAPLTADSGFTGSGTILFALVTAITGDTSFTGSGTRDILAVTASLAGDSGKVGAGTLDVIAVAVAQSAASDFAGIGDLLSPPGAFGINSITTLDQGADVSFTTASGSPDGYEFETIAVTPDAAPVTFSGNSGSTGAGTILDQPAFATATAIADWVGIGAVDRVAVSASFDANSDIVGIGVTDAVFPAAVSLDQASSFDGFGIDDFASIPMSFTGDTSFTGSGTLIYDGSGSSSSETTFIGAGTSLLSIVAASFDGGSEIIGVGDTNAVVAATPVSFDATADIVGAGTVDASAPAVALNATSDFAGAGTNSTLQLSAQFSGQTDVPTVGSVQYNGTGTFASTADFTGLGSANLQPSIGTLSAQSDIPTIGALQIIASNVAMDGASDFNGSGSVTTDVTFIFSGDSVATGSGTVDVIVSVVAFDSTADFIGSGDIGIPPIQISPISLDGGANWTGLGGVVLETGPVTIDSGSDMSGAGQFTFPLRGSARADSEWSGKGILDVLAPPLALYVLSNIAGSGGVDWNAALAELSSSSNFGGIGHISQLQRPGAVTTGRIARTTGGRPSRIAGGV